MIPLWRSARISPPAAQPGPAAPAVTQDAAERSETVSNVLYAAVLESRTRWRQMVQSAADLVFETDPAGNLVYLWPATVLGWPAASLLGTQAAALLAKPREDFNPFAPGPAQPHRPAGVRLHAGL